MSVSLKTKIMLWGRAAGYCAFPGCGKHLVVDATETDDPSLIGEACHIVGDKESAARGISDLSDEQRDKYDNLVLLCNTHHKIVDDQRVYYTVDLLKKYKKDHEQWVKNKLTDFDELRQKDVEAYASIVEEWQKKSMLDNWNGWTSFLLSNGHPTSYIDHIESLVDCKKYIFSRIWPGRFADLEGAFENFRAVLNDLLLIFREYSENNEGSNMYSTRKFYITDNFDQQRYGMLLERYNYHVDLVQDLVLELTRAANYIIRLVRIRINSSFREIEGLAFVTTGPNSRLEWESLRPQYDYSKNDVDMYNGLELFKSERSKRDVYFGR